ncbi:uncharacterized protein LOC106370001 [Brassica napus]|uniref:(rape) hypothetical protein n=2 Tax=Brassica napus TaxID=3708 RepID=A0A816JLV5_BRANA|nr:uncharacterized protein LOC106435862 [Brassica napus]XP_013732245.1 uncharacterized protein LOC106435862 [Brassica napus]XP_048624382.1 uncharacterized protein LOC106370001 [Brassica napus]XP_048624383.1 uncharacterized protein LOC106370001 [Brassica napus]CAF1793148.1 unnamed protein product [Brassica napus]
MGDHRKECDEVVKYMSKLPPYLQGGEEESNVLNVGVLDWSRLEKWKQKCERRVSSTTTTTLATLPNASSHRIHRCKIGDHQVHAGSNLRKKVKASRDLQLGVRCNSEFASSSRDSPNKQEMPTCSYNKSSARDEERVNKSRRSPSSSGLLSTMGNSWGSLGTKETEKRAQEEAKESRKQCVVDKLNREDKTVVLLRSRRSTLSSQPPPLDHNASKVAASELLDSSSLQLTSRLPPRSCPLSFHFGRDSEDIMLLPLLGGVDLSPSSGTTRHSKTASSRIFDQQDKIRHDNTSPSKRFSFSFGRLSRSFTFREDSSATDSMRFDGLACPSHQSSNTEEEKHNTHGGGSRVSPLRRLLDPLLMKPKVSTSSNQDEKKKQSRTRALLQLTIRNGIPLFQFVVDDDNLNNKSRSILGATMKSSDSSFKDEDSVKYCTFYSVNEVKKKKSGSWLIHGHKDKQQQQDRFVYNVIGEMRLCNSDITEHKPENISCVMRESVLVDETEEQVKGRKEVAAVVIKKGETTVIIPGGVHSIPEKGEPTTLIRRWRSGGCCDCGGWDVGCKLHVLSNNTLLHDFDQTFTLFDQEESDKNTGPVLGMTELKTGMYRVEFGSFLSHLQAFFVCVTVVTCASEEETVSKTTAKTSSPFAPPLSPVGRA